MIILGINSSHNASMCLLENDKIIFNIELERLNNIKYGSFSLSYINLIKNFTKKVDYIAIAGIYPMDKAYKSIELEEFNPYVSSVFGIDKSFYLNGLEMFDFTYDHHLTHASCAFYNSGFEEALCIVKDGIGSFYNFENNENFKNIVAKENNTSFVCSYPNKFDIIDKSLFVFDNKLKLLNLNKYYINNTTYLTNSMSEGMAFGVIAEKFGFNRLDAGKVMGMSAYGSDDNTIPPMYKNKKINDELFMQNSKNEVFFNYQVTDDFNQRANIAYALQKESEKNIYEYIISMIEKTNQKNICLTGGFFLNCVANYKILQKLPSDINLYVEPISSDAGTAVGAAKYLYHSLTKNKKINKQQHIYYGFSNKFKKQYFKNVKIIKNVLEKDVAKLLADRKIIAIYQGNSESGPRALGNRSILYDPTDLNGKNVINKIKKREWFRPFAGSVLFESAKEWFDLDKLEESPFMMYAVNTLKEKQKEIPAIVHVDGTCRIQTVKEKQNKIFYNLIKEFYNLTNVPILMNTSFNLAGDCIVETVPQALNTLKNSEIDYVYFPEKQILVSKNV